MIDEELRNFGRNNQLGFMDSHLDDSGEVRNESQESLSTKEQGLLKTGLEI